jgi:hypothetical protein
MGLLGGMFVAGSAFMDPGGWVAVALTALWVLPTAGLSILTLRRPITAGRTLVWVTAGVLLLSLADAALDIVPRDDWGPVAAIAVFALLLPLGVLGLHQARRVGLLMVVAGLAQLVATMIATAVHADGGPAVRLNGSSGAVVLPLLIVGVLFLLAGSLERESPHAGSSATVRPVH